MTESMRGARFLGVGLAGFAMQTVALSILTWMHVRPVVAIAVAVEVAILHNFFWHERWTWGDRRLTHLGSALAKRFLRFNAASGIVSIAGNVTLTTLFVDALHLPLLAANVLAVMTLSAVNYALADRIVFAAGESRMSLR